MNTNEQQTKTLGQIAYEAIYPTWSWGACPDKQGYEKAASAVEAAVLSRMGGEWMKLPDGSILKKGEEEYKANVGWELFLCRRIQPSPTPEVHVATESSAGRLEQEECPSCGGSGDKYHGPYKIVSESCPTCNGIGILSCDTQRSTRRPLPQPPATPAGEAATFWEDKCKYLEGVRDRLTEQLQQVTRERDEARGWLGKRCPRIGGCLLAMGHDSCGCVDGSTDFGAESFLAEARTRAESAEKRLAEVERELEEVRPFRDAALNPFNAIKDAK